MKPRADEQLQLRFDSLHTCDGYSGWIEQRRAALERLAREVGLPLGHRVELWLSGGIRLRGILGFNDELLFVPEKRDETCQFAVDGVPFSAAEIESCVRVD